MADFQPLRATLYNPQKIQWEEVLTEPYDKITSEMQEKYYARSPYNAVRVVLGKDTPRDTPFNNKYTRANRFYRDWLEERVLVQMPFAGYYVLEQEFKHDGKRHCRRALIGRVRLTPFEDGVVRAHERTHAGPKADRLALLRATEAHWEQVFLLGEFKIKLMEIVEQQPRKTPYAEFTDDLGVTHRLWEVSLPGSSRDLEERFRHKPLYVADGHHRYETALAYRNECRAKQPRAGAQAPFEFCSAAVVALDDPGLVILPTHRLVRQSHPFGSTDLMANLAKTFQIESVASLEEMLARMGTARGDAHSFGLALPEGKFHVLNLRRETDLKPLFRSHPPLWDTLDAPIAHVLILEPLGVGTAFPAEESLSYHRDPREVIEGLQQGKGSLGLFLNPTKVEQVRAIADAGSRMPQKSTDFFPKLPSGLVIYDMQ
jgi:uncharacterized protein (DUF1015 family)